MCCVIFLKNVKFDIFIGRYDLHWCSLVCEGCDFVQPMSVTNIINEGYLPGSPCQVNYLFDQEEFRVWESFRMRMPGSSESAFIKALEDISSAKGRVRLKQTVFYVTIMPFYVLYMSHVCIIHNMVTEYYTEVHLHCFLCKLYSS